jgi:adenosylmethionine-8-amino-7-oxononanoate aminotransferase
LAEPLSAVDSSHPGLPSDTLERLSVLDVEHLVHPFTSLQEHARLGPRIFVAAEGVRVRDAQGRWYIDAYAGQGNCLVDAVRRVLTAAQAEL